MSKPEEPTPRKRGLDVELQTMARIDRHLAELTAAQVARVLAWLCDKWDDTPTPTVTSVPRRNCMSGSIDPGFTVGLPAIGSPYPQ